MVIVNVLGKRKSEYLLLLARPFAQKKASVEHKNNGRPKIKVAQIQIEAGKF